VGGTKVSFDDPVDGRNAMENHGNSNLKKIRKQGFRARRRTKSGRKILSNQRALRAGAKKRK
jgi:ribosomal protein L34